MHRNTWEIAVDKDVVQLGAADGAPHEDDDLVERESIEEVVELSILLRFAKLDIVLIQPMQCQFGLVVNEQFRRILHELSADGSYLLRKSSAEHHDLLLRWRGAEYFLHVTAHI